MTVSGGMLARLFTLAVATIIITPTFYAHALAVESEHGEQSVNTQKDKSESAENQASAVSRGVRIKAACIKVRTSISNRTANLQQASERRIGVIDKVYGNLTTFANNNRLTVPEANRQAVLSTHAAASDAIQQLANSEDALNCEDTNVGQAAAALKLHIQTVNDTMHAYRQAVGDMLVAIKTQALTGGMND